MLLLLLVGTARADSFVSMPDSLFIPSWTGIYGQPTTAPACAASPDMKTGSECIAYCLKNIRIVASKENPGVEYPYRLLLNTPQQGKALKTNAACTCNYQLATDAGGKKVPIVYHTAPFMFFNVSNVALSLNYDSQTPTITATMNAGCTVLVSRISTDTEKKSNGIGIGIVPGVISVISLMIFGLGVLN